MPISTHQISCLLDRPIAYHPCFVPLTGGSVTAAVMLSQALYWQIRNGNGWWFQSREKWTDETGLTRTEQETARRVMREIGFWHEKREGIPARMYYRIDLEALMEKIATLPTRRQESCQLEGGFPASSQAEFLPSIGKENKKETKEENTLPAATAGRARNELLDALVSLDGSDPIKATRPAFSMASKALKDIRDVFPSVTPEEIRRRAANYKARYPNAAVTPTAIAKHWAAMDASPSAEPTQGDWRATKSINDTIRRMEEAIANHPANPEFREYLPELVTKAQRDDLDAARQRLCRLRKISTGGAS